MKTLSKAVAVASLLSAGIMSAQVANAEVSFNAAATSNYIWRGATQTNNASAVSGGADYAHESGASAGVWTSNVAGDTEIDYYASYGAEVGGVALSAGVISYDYNTDTADFVEVNVGAAFAAASLSYSVKVDDGDTNKDNDDAAYISLGYGLSLAEDLSLDLALGQTMDASKASSSADKYDYLAALTKSLPDFDFTLAIANLEDGENEMFVAVSKSF
jgi:uncharacterized protein (TIGR02001 family)